MARNLVAVKFDVSKLDAFQAKLGTLTPESLGETLVEVVNEVAEDAYSMSRETILSGLNLTDAYLRSKMGVDKATAAKPTATIVAQGDRGTGLAHYGGQQQDKAVNWTNSRIEASGFEFGAWPLWTERIGDEGRGIEEGKKLAKYSVEVTRGKRKNLKAFTIPGIDHTDGTPVMFINKGTPGSGKLDKKRKVSRNAVKALYGPSVYQLFRTAAKQIGPWVADDLEVAVLNAVDSQIKSALT